MSNFVKLISLCFEITDGSHFSPKSISIGYPMLSVKDMRFDGFDYSSCNHISKDDYEKMVRSGCVPRKNDVLIAKDGSYLKEIFVVEEEREQAILSSIGIIRPNIKIVNPYFLKYYLSTKYVKEQVARKYVSGSALPRIILKNFKDIDIPSIKLDAQNKIVSVLKSIDDKIAINNKINSELESMAKTLYDYWFLQFDFPNKDGKPYKTSGGKMVWNEKLKKEIPEGWNAKELDKCCDIVLGGTPKTEVDEYWHGNINWLNSGEIANFPVACSEVKISSKGLENSATTFMKKGSVVVSITGNLRASILAIDSCANQSVVGILENNIFKSSYIYPFMKDMISIFMKVSTGNCQQHINKGTIQNTFLLVPSDTILEAYYGKVNYMYSMIFNKALQNQELFSLRDFLLPLLMNGQAYVK